MPRRHSAPGAVSKHSDPNHVIICHADIEDALPTVFGIALSLLLQGEHTPSFNGE